jgi:meiotically up-regulated gene 157 (Mug157) protein
MAIATRRPPKGERRFSSAAVESTIERVASQVKDAEMPGSSATVFPNTLDTTVTLGKDARGRDDTFVITGDIDAMWLRDSTAQVWPYLPLLAEDPALRRLVAGVINRQIACVRIDPYANAFLVSPSDKSKWATDQTEMRPGVYERKYELDSLCSVLRLSIGYFRACGDASCFDEDWQAAVDLIVRTIRAEQRGSEQLPPSPYRLRARRCTRRARCPWRNPTLRPLPPNWNKHEKQSLNLSFNRCRPPRSASIICRRRKDAWNRRAKRRPR